MAGATVLAAVRNRPATNSTVEKVPEQVALVESIHVRRKIGKVPSGACGLRWQSEAATPLFYGTRVESCYYRKLFKSAVAAPLCRRSPQ
jgi:hypothetical protein